MSQKPQSMKSVVPISTIDCTRCHAPIDPLTAEFCEDVALLCEICGLCLCHAPVSQMSDFWRLAPEQVTERWAEEWSRRWEG